VQYFWKQRRDTFRGIITHRTTAILFSVLRTHESFYPPFIIPRWMVEVPLSIFSAGRETFSIRSLVRRPFPLDPVWESRGEESGGTHTTCVLICNARCRTRARTVHVRTRERDESIKAGIRNDYRATSAIRIARLSSITRLRASIPRLCSKRFARSLMRLRRTENATRETKSAEKRAYPMNRSAR